MYTEIMNNEIVISEVSHIVNQHNAVKRVWDRSRSPFMDINIKKEVSLPHPVYIIYIYIYIYIYI
jgi:hypothetical protein